ncbi:hypothetical protein MycrhDRAFT_5786 [Mycolicibacterium rhodesiae JS60]|nr:hypothetical protein MycrhDRAFT_5786 [Mycolicibacterium rhodesiae JS60]
MADPVLVVTSDYTVEYAGRKLALGSPIKLHWLDARTNPRMQISFDCVEIPPEAPVDRYPKRRKVSEALGLRRPK